MTKEEIDMFICVHSFDGTQNLGCDWCGEPQVRHRYLRWFPIPFLFDEGVHHVKS